MGDDNLEKFPSSDAKKSVAGNEHELRGSDEKPQSKFAGEGILRKGGVIGLLFFLLVATSAGVSFCLFGQAIFLPTTEVARIKPFQERRFSKEVVLSHRAEEINAGVVVSKKKGLFFSEPVTVPVELHGPNLADAQISAQLSDGDLSSGHVKRPLAQVETMGNGASTSLAPEGNEMTQIQVGSVDKPSGNKKTADGTFLGVEVGDTRPCIRLKRLDIEDKNINKNLFLKYMQECIDEKLINGILTDISKYYMRRGLVTTQPYLKEQTISDGQIEVSVFEGIIENIVDATTKTSNLRIKTAFLFQKNSVLNLKDLETSLEMMNRVPSSEVKFEIKPGSKHGTSLIEINQVQAFPYHLKVGVSGRQKITDSNPYLTAELSIDNPLNINDILAFRYNGSSVQKEYQSNKGGEVNYSFPLASYLTEIVWSKFSYRQGVDGINDTFLSSGDTEGLRLRVGKVLMRNQNNKLNCAFSVYYKSTKNYFADQLIEVSSYATSLAQVDLTHTYIPDWGRLTTTYSYYQGTGWFGARGDGFISAETDMNDQAKLEFKKHSVDVGLLYYLKNRSYQLTSNFHIQYTNDLLYDNDKLTVGSDYTVRGYLSSNLYGNNAWYVSNDITKTWLPDIQPALLQTVLVFTGLDFGNVRCEKDNRGSCGEIYGAALGFGTDAQNLSTRFVWSQPLKKINATFQRNSLFKFDLTWKF